MLTNLEPGEWVTYTVHVPTAAAYRIDVRYAATTDGGALRLSFGGTDVTADVTLPSTAGAWTTLTVASCVRLAAGVQAMRVFVAGTAGAYQVETVTVAAL